MLGYIAEARQRGRKNISYINTSIVLTFSHAQYRKTLNLTLDHLPNLLADHTLRKVSFQFNTLYLLLQDEK